MTDSSRRLNTLSTALGARRYLEIGVSDAETFHAVQTAERTGVDPAFTFDIASVADAHTRLVPLTSDAFFAAEPLQPPYDLIFIDGLHKFEQVVRDFSNVILRTHRRSAILIDDTVPSNVHSSFPDENTTRRRRHAAGIQDDAWHGDVYKLVFYLHDFWPSLNYRTIVGSGNPQTLVWQATGQNRKPFLDDFEFIARLTYFDMLDCAAILQPASEDEAIALCVNEINATQ